MDRSFATYGSFTNFYRSHLRGNIWGVRLKGHADWSLVVYYRGYEIGQARFKKIRDGEKWALG